MTPGGNPSCDTPGSAISDVLDILRQSRALLLDPSPRNIDRCRIAISQCVARVENLVGQDRSGWNGRDVRDGLLVVRGELAAITTLLDSAAIFRRDMLKVISGATPSPQIVAIDDPPVPKARRVHVLG